MTRVEIFQVEGLNDASFMAIIAMMRAATLAVTRQLQGKLAQVGSYSVYGAFGKRPGLRHHNDHQRPHLHLYIANK